MIYVFAGIGLAVIIYLLIRGVVNYRSNIIDLSDKDK